MLESQFFETWWPQFASEYSGRVKFAFAFAAVLLRPRCTQLPTSLQNHPSPQTPPHHQKKIPWFDHLVLTVVVSGPSSEFLDVLPLGQLPCHRSNIGTHNANFCNTSGHTPTPLCRGRTTHPKSRNTKKHRVYANFFEKFARTLPPFL